MPEVALMKKVRNQAQKISKMPFYRSKFDEWGLNPDDLKSIEDFRKIPFMTLNDIQKDLEDHPPFGLLFHPETVRIHFSPGPKGLLPISFTERDIKDMNKANARCFKSAGVTSDDVVAVTFNYHLFIAGHSIQGGFETLGSKTIPVGPGETDRTAEILQRFGVTVLAANPSFAAKLAEKGVRGIRVLFAGGEPLSSVEGYKEKLRSLFGNITLIDVYGLAQAAPLARECRYETGLHVIDDLFFVEIIDPEAGDVLPDGQKGEVVVTHLIKESAPLLRFRTGDLSVMKHFKCSCGRTTTLPKGVVGSAKEMVKVKGVKLYPSQIPLVLKTFPELTGKYRILISSTGTTETLQMLLEGNVTQGYDISSLRKRLKEALLILPNQIEVVKNLEDGPNIMDQRHIV